MHKNTAKFCEKRKINLRTYPCLPRAQFVTSCRQNFKNACHFSTYLVGVDCAGGIVQGSRNTRQTDRSIHTYNVIPVLE